MLRYRSAARNSIMFAAFVTVLSLQGCSGTARAPVSSPGENVGLRSPSVSDSQRSRARQSTIPDRGYHVVNRGDTLYAIAWRYRLDHRKVARWNNIGPPYTIYPGDKIRLRPPEQRAPSAPLARRSDKPSPPLPSRSGKADKTADKPAARQSSQPKSRSSVATGGPIEWAWPTQGKLINASTPTAEKGITIGGQPGQTIQAAAPGQVVYSGSGLIGYGKLIIIKHNETYLSAYAHNDELLVKEGDSVSGGQRISTMGADSSGRAALHFEIRRDGQPIDPLQQLPQRRG